MHQDLNLSVLPFRPERPGGVEGLISTVIPTVKGSGAEPKTEKTAPAQLQ